MRAILIFTTVSLLCGHSAAIEPMVVGHLPDAQELRAVDNSAIELSFDQPMDPTSVDGRSFRVFGRWSGPADLSFEWLDQNERLIATPAESFSAGEMVTVYVARTLRSSLGETLARGVSWQFWIEAMPAPFSLERGTAVSTRLPGEILARSYGGYGGDLNGDGHLDLAITNENSDDLRIFYNDGAGNFDSFERLPLLDAGGPSANEGADFNHDGQIDLVIGNAFADATMVLLGDGLGSFEPFVPYTTARGVRAVGVLDLDGDACEDIVSACKTGDRLAILRGDGSGAFASAELRNTPGIGESALAVGDANGDGLLDLFLASDPGADVQLLLGDGEGDLQPTDTVEARGRPWVLAAGDLDGDHLCDVVTAGGYASNVAVILSAGDGRLRQAVTLATGNLTVSVDLGDLDGDGDLDIVASNLFEGTWTLYANDGSGNFSGRIDLRATAGGSCAILHDRDGDGVLDLTAVDEIADEIVLFEHFDGAPILPTRLLWNEPNPFNPDTNILFHIQRPGVYRMEIFDGRGRLVDRVFERRWDEGDHSVSWSGIDFKGRAVGSGVYRLRLEGPGATDTRSLVLLR